MSDQVGRIRMLFWRTDPELVLEKFVEENKQVTFRLLDCDGYRLGWLVMSGVSALCAATYSVAYSGFDVLRGDQIYRSTPWLQGTALAQEDILIILTPSRECEEENLILPVVDGKKCAFILCRDVSFKEETTPGR